MSSILLGSVRTIPKRYFSPLFGHNPVLKSSLTCSRASTEKVKVRTVSSMTKLSQSELVSTSEDDLRLAGQRLADGNLVAFPTETVYGLGANALDKNAVLNIFKAKGRPLTDPLIVHVTSLQSALELVNVEGHTREMFIYLAETFWPGPLTLVAKAVESLPLELSAGTGYVGVRCPALQVARDLIGYAKVPVAAPSANRFGHVSPTNAQHVLYDLGTKGVTIVDGGECCQVGIESTVIKVNDVKDGNELVLYRKGGISQEALEEALKAKGWFDNTVISIPEKAKRNTNNTNNPVESTNNLVDSKVIGDAAPGQELTHYAPDVNTWLIGTSALQALKSLRVSDSNLKQVSLKTESGESETISLNRSVIVDFGGCLSDFQNDCLAYRDLSSSEDVSEAAGQIFTALRWSESIPGAQTVLLTDLNNGGCSTNVSGREHIPAVLDRMYRAASGKVANEAL